MNDSRYPWLLLVPRREDVTEIFHLRWEDQVQLARESDFLARRLSGAFSPDKLNIAAIGNLVPQLHLHHVVRYRGDTAWPSPVWGLGTPTPYSDTALESTIHRLTQTLSGASEQGMELLPV
jgi:diadenosine tetraphosphate (Ap4A) HIT family hydrolase